MNNIYPIALPTHITSLGITAIERSAKKFPVVNISTAINKNNKTNHLKSTLTSPTAQLMFLYRVRWITSSKPFNCKKYSASLAYLPFLDKTVQVKYIDIKEDEKGHMLPNYTFMKQKPNEIIPNHILTLAIGTMENRSIKHMKQMAKC